MSSQFRRPFFGLKSAHFWGVITILVVAAISSIIVAVFKKPGQMGVIESQSMNMSNMKPPSGSVPVAIATVSYKPVEGTIVYTGTVQAFTEEDVYPRITGRIVNEPVYPGDHVRKGQLLVQLDPANSEYASREREASLAARAAMHNAKIAHEEAQAKVAQAKAQASAQQEAIRGLQQADANLAYWEKEIQREKILVAQQVISKQEYDNELSQYEQAKAQTLQARAKVDEEGQKKVAAKDEAEAGMHHTKHQSEEAQRAQAEAKTAAIVQSYTRITASDNGVVTKRMVAPGVVVNTGTAILRVEHIDYVRVQAQVSQEDLARIRTGAATVIALSQQGPEIAKGYLSSKFPAADPTSRTFIVESLIPNTGYKLLPGQYVVMTISTGEPVNALAVPSSSIVWSGQQPQVWKAVGGDKRAVAQLQNIKIGNFNDEFTEVTSGLKEGEKVVTNGQDGLLPGVFVVAVEWGPDGPANLPTPAQASGIRLSKGNNWTIQLQPSSDLKVHVTMKPIPPKPNENSIIFKVEDSMGMPVAGATIKAATSMPTMNMAGPDLQAKETANGTYEMNSNFMSDLWSMDMALTTNKKAEKFTVEVDIP